MHIPSKDSCSEMQTNVIHEEKIFRPQGTGMMSLSDSIQGELDDLEVHGKAERHHPISKEQFWGYFDSDGRIVDETQLRRTIFKGMHGLCHLIIVACLFMLCRFCIIHLLADVGICRKAITCGPHVTHERFCGPCRAFSNVLCKWLIMSSRGLGPMESN